MAKITLVEARLLSEALYQKIDWAVRQINSLIDNQNKDMKITLSQEVPSLDSSISVEEYEESELRKEVIQKTKKPEKSLEELYESLEEIQLERNRLCVAIAKFEATQTLDF